MRELIDKTVLASRWILALFFLGLLLALAAYAARFVIKLFDFIGQILTAEETDMLIGLLHLLDSALVASLVVTVAMASYDSLVSRLAKDDKAGEASWVASIDPGNLKIKLATALIAISSIYLLQIFMEVQNYDDRAVLWGLALHAMFLAGALVLGLLDRLTAISEKGKL